MRRAAAPRADRAVGELDASGFRGRLAYDGCTVTFQHFELRPSVEEMQRRLAGHPTPHVGLAHRAYALWRGDLLVPDARVCCFGLPVARREIAPDGTPRLALVNAARRCPEGCGDARPLVRFTSAHCLDPNGDDLLCAREIVARGTSPE